MVVFTPCTDGVEELTGRYPVTFTHALAFDEESGQVLLKNEDAYWLLDGTSLEARQIPGITPGPSELQPAWYAWSPGGERLAITLMEKAGNGATLEIVNVATGEVERSLPLEDASDANLPWVEWLTRDELLQDMCLHSRNWFSVPREAFRWFRFPAENWSVSGNWRAEGGTTAP